MTEAVNREQAIYICRNGKLWPITNWFDDRGEDCTADEATRAVAGEGRRWFTIDLTQFESGSLQ